MTNKESDFDWKKYAAVTRKIRADHLREWRRVHGTVEARKMKKLGDELAEFVIAGFRPGRTR